MPVSLPVRMRSSTRARVRWRSSSPAILVGLVGQKTGVAVPMLIEDLKLRARMRTLASADRPRVLWLG